MDIVDRATRSRMMSGIRGKDTRPELRVRSFLHRTGLRFRLHPNLPGRPDLVFPKFRTAVFVHGCFWHRHEGCRFATTPSSNALFWEKKFTENVRRDARNEQQLKDLGWRVLVVWACELNDRELRKIATKVTRGTTRGRTIGKSGR